MTLLGKLRFVPLVFVAAGMSLALGFAQNQSPPAQPSEERSTRQPETPSASGSSAPTKTTGPAAPNQQQPTATPQTSNQQPRSRKTKTRPQKINRTNTTESGKVVVANGGAKEHTEQLTPAMSKEQQVRERENTNQLLATTDRNLKSIAGRELTPAQQNMLAHIHSYVSQSKAAAAAGDLARANTLASKAHLLSDELAKK